jgi:hypothetical protein
MDKDGHLGERSQNVPGPADCADIQLI